MEEEEEWKDFFQFLFHFFPEISATMKSVPWPLMLLEA